MEAFINIIFLENKDKINNNKEKVKEDRGNKEDHKSIIFTYFS